MLKLRTMVFILFMICFMFPRFSFFNATFGGIQLSRCLDGRTGTTVGLQKKLRFHRRLEFFAGLTLELFLPLLLGHLLSCG